MDFRNTSREVWDGRFFCLLAIAFGVFLHWLYPFVDGTKGIVLDITKIGCVSFGGITMIASFVPSPDNQQRFSSDASQPKSDHAQNRCSSVPLYKQAKKRSRLLLASACIAAFYIVFFIYSFVTASSGAESKYYALGVGIAVYLSLPHLLCVIIALVFNILGWSLNHRGFALTGGVLYSVSMLLFPLYFMWVILEVIFSFVGFSNLKKINNANQHNQFS